MHELCELHNIFKQNFLMFQFIKLAKILFFGFTFKLYKIIHFQSQNMGEKVVLPPNKLKHFLFFSKA